MFWIKFAENLLLLTSRGPLRRQAKNSLRRQGTEDQPGRNLQQGQKAWHYDLEAISSGQAHMTGAYCMNVEQNQISSAA
jgi:hypothetical protein